MLSILEQLQGMTRSPASSTIPRRVKPHANGVGHNLLSHEIDQIALDLVAKSPGMYAKELYDREAPLPISAMSLQAALRRLNREGSLCAARHPGEKARYWPLALRHEAEAYLENPERRGATSIVRAAIHRLDKPFKVVEISALTNTDRRAVSKAVTRMHEAGLLTAVGKDNGKVLWGKTAEWPAKSERW